MHSLFLFLVNYQYFKINSRLMIVKHKSNFFTYLEKITRFRHFKLPCTITTTRITELINMEFPYLLLLRVNFHWTFHLTRKISFYSSVTTLLCRIKLRKVKNLKPHWENFIQKIIFQFFKNYSHHAQILHLKNILSTVYINFY